MSLLHYTGDLHRTFHLQLNLILEEGYKLYHSNVGSYVLQKNGIRFISNKPFIILNYKNNHNDA